MSDVIKFDEFKNKARDKEIDKLEDYIYSLYYKMAEGKISFADMNKEIMNYVNENGISMEKFNEMQLKLVERYGFDPETIKENLNVEGLDKTLNIAMTLKNKYGDSLNLVRVIKKHIKNEKNDIFIICEGNEITMFSENTIDLEDNELHDFLVSYRRQLKEESLKIRMGDNYSEFTY